MTLPQERLHHPNLLTGDKVYMIIKDISQLDFHKIFDKAIVSEV